MGVLIDPVDGTTDVEPLPCVQTAPVRPLRPEAWSVISGAAIEVAAKCAVTGVTTSDQQWGRVGVAVKLASTSSETFGTVTVRFWVARVSCGMAVGSVSAMLNPATSQQNAVFVVGGPVPTLGITAFKAAVMVQGLTGGSVKGQLVVRLYATDLEKPGPWLALETLRTFTTDDEVNTGELDPTGLTGWGAAMFCEIGYQAQPQTANVQATVKVSAVAKL